MIGILKKIMGSKSDKDLKELKPLVGQVNSEYEKLASITDEQLRNRTQEIKDEIKKELKSIDDKIEQLTEKTKKEDIPVHEKEDLFDEIDKLEEARNKDLEKVLLEVLPKAFAVVKETARRFKENEKLEVSATMHDKTIAAKKSNVEIVGETAIWHNKWLAAGTEVTWDMLHYDVQLIGGAVLHQGKIAEMATGEGKTLVATLPAYLNALAERGVHIVTVNDYLARRDMEWMAPLFEFHGLRVDCIDLHRPHSEERKSAYEADITYGTNNEFGFDYLRDNMAKSPDELVQPRHHHYAMVDEVDSVLVDDARTPLIISGPIPKGDEHEFNELKPLIHKLVDEQRRMSTAYLQEAKKLIKEGKESEAGLPLFRAYRSMPKAKPLIKFLGETGMKTVLQKTENIYIAENNKRMPEADEPLFFTIDEKNNNIELTEKGIDLLSNDVDKDAFMLPDIGVELDGIEKEEGLSESQKLEKKEELIKGYSERSQRIHSINQLLKAYTLFEKDVDYIVADGKVLIVDEQTGRVLDGRRYSDGLHQAIEAKENVKIEDATQTYATVTLQNYFRMYHKLAGMTGTAETEAGEFWEIYKLDVVVIPTNRPIARKDHNDKVFKTVREKFNAVSEEIVELTKEGRPVLVGTTSVEISEVLSRMLQMRNIDHNVLNAKQHAREADIVAEAGQPGKVTIATNMAGRGTDIKLTPESKAAGGLAIIGTERHESRRVDRQLRGRSGRQGDPGSSQFFVSLEDNLMRLFGSERIAKIMDRLGLKEGEVIQHSMITKSITRAQRKVEENNFSIRKRLLEYDDVMNHQREVIYSKRRNALYGDRLAIDVLNMIYDTCEDIVNEAKSKAQDPQEQLENFRLNVIGVFGFDSSLSAEELDKQDPDSLTQKLFKEANSKFKESNQKLIEGTLPSMRNIFDERGATVENIVVPFISGRRQVPVVLNLKELVEREGRPLPLSLQKMTTLDLIDDEWKEHLRAMDDLKQSVQNAVHEQKDPLLIYKFEAFELFESLVSKINRDIVSFLFKAEIKTNDPSEIREARQTSAAPALNENKDEAQSLLSGGGAPQAQPQGQNRPPVPPRPMQSSKVYGRNDRVSVQYLDGSIKEDVKFKTVEEDIAHNKCVLIEDE